MPMPAKRGQDDFFFARCFAGHCLADGRGQRMGGLGCRHNALGFGKFKGAVEAFGVRNRDRLYEPPFVDVRDQWRHSVVSESASVYGFRNERRAEGVHFHQRCEACCVSKVIAVFALGECWARRRFNTTNDGIHFARHLLAQKWKGETTKVGAATSAPNQNIGRLADFSKLQKCFFADDRLVEQYMV